MCSFILHRNLTLSNIGFYFALPKDSKHGNYQSSQFIKEGLLKKSKKFIKVENKK